MKIYQKFSQFYSIIKIKKAIPQKELSNFIKISFAKNKKNDYNYLTMKYKFSDKRQLFLGKKFEILNRKKYRIIYNHKIYRAKEKIKIGNTLNKYIKLQ